MQLGCVLFCIAHICIWSEKMMHASRLHVRAGDHAADWQPDCMSALHMCSDTTPLATDLMLAWQVVDVGVMCPWEKILDAAEEHKVCCCFVPEHSPPSP